MSSATPVTLITSGYASTTNPCVLSYSLLNSDGTSYSGSDVSIDSSTGAVSIVSNVLFSENLKIKGTSTYSAVSVNLLSSNDTICIGTSISLSASGGTSYSWSNGATTNTVSWS